MYEFFFFKSEDLSDVEGMLPVVIRIVEHTRPVMADVRYEVQCLFDR